MRAAIPVVGVILLAAVVSLVGDAGHVASGTTHYDWHGLPTVWRSVLWFPLLVVAGVLGTAVAGRDAGAPQRRVRGPGHVVAGAVLVLALYLLTALWRDVAWVPATAITTVLAVAIWAWWDPGPVAFVSGVVSALVGPVAEIVLVAVGAAHYAADSDGLAGVAPWLVPLYFAAGAVGSGIWRPLDRGLTPAHAARTGG